MSRRRGPITLLRDLAQAHRLRLFCILSLLASIGAYFAIYRALADVKVFGGPNMLSQYPLQTVDYRLGNYELGDWSESFFAPAAYVDRKVLRRGLWSEDLQPRGGGTVNAWKHQPQKPWYPSTVDEDFEELQSLIRMTSDGKPSNGTVDSN